MTPVNLLIEQILMDEQIESEGTIGIDDVIRELKHGIHEIEYEKTVKERISRGNYKHYNVVKKYKITNDPSIFEKLLSEEDAESSVSPRRDHKVRAGLNAVHRLVTVFDVEAKTFKTLKYANILTFDEIKVNHDDSSNPVTAAHKETGDAMFRDYEAKAKEIPGYKTQRGRHLSGIATDTSHDPKELKDRERTSEGRYKERMNKLRGMQHMFRNRASDFERDNNERIY